MFFFNDTATTEIYTLSLHDALPILSAGPRRDPATERRELERLREVAERQAVLAELRLERGAERARLDARRAREDRKSTRLNSSHANISYAVFCLKKKIIYFTCTSNH